MSDITIAISDYELHVAISAQGVQGEHAVTFANATERASRVPTFVGQLGLQLDTLVLYRGTALTAGSWTATAASMVGAPALAHAHTGTTDSPKLSQANTHESADTDAAPTSLHHTTGTGANQAATGNHGHTRAKALTFDFDGGGAALATATKCLLPYLPANFTPTRWTVQCSSAARNAAAANASVAMTVTVGNFSTSGLPAGATGGTQPSVTTAIGATAAATFTDLVWDAGQAVMVEVTGTPTALWATLTIEGTVTA